MGWTCPPFYGKSKFYEEKKAKALNKIEELKKVVEVCDEELAKINAENKD